MKSNKKKATVSCYLSSANSQVSNAVIDPKEKNAVGRANEAKTPKMAFFTIFDGL